MPLKRQFCSAMQGLIVINKPKGITSFGVVARLRKILGEKRIGHTGTLDPMATGVLVCLVGRPCVLSNYIMSGSKGYIAKLKLGIKTDSYDITGEVINSSQKTVSKEEFLELGMKPKEENKTMIDLYTMLFDKARNKEEF